MNYWYVAFENLFQSSLTLTKVNIELIWMVTKFYRIILKT